MSASPISLRIAAAHRPVVILLGFASGLPLTCIATVLKVKPNEASDPRVYRS